MGWMATWGRALLVGCLAVLAGTAAQLVVTSTPAAAQTSSFTMSTRSGPVGTVVKLAGSLGPSCAAQLPSLDGQATAFLQFQKGSQAGDPNEWINVPVASDGAWAASFTIPSFVGGQAMTQGSLGADVTPGLWQFGIPACSATPTTTTVDFDVTATRPVASRFVGMAPTADGHGYWLAQANGGVFSYGDAAFYGSLPGIGIVPAGAITGIAATPDGRGYWLVGADGGVFAFGDAAYAGNGRDGIPKVALLATPDGGGYLLPSATGLPPAALGDAVAYQQSPMALAALVTGAASTPSGGGAWEVGTDGGVFTFGDAAFLGSMGSQALTNPITAMAATPSGDGYWLLPTVPGYAEPWLLGTVWTRIPTTARLVALTFDAGANADGLASILDTLQTTGVPATFFLTGAFVQAYPAQSATIAQRGYRLGDHSVDHPSFPTLTDDQIRAEVLDAATLIRATTGGDPAPLLRFPYGDYDARSLSVVNAVGYAAVGWTVDTLGWEGTSAGITPGTIVDRVLTAAVPGEIVLMHVGSNPTDHSTLDAQALPSVIAALRGAGYSFVTLDALLR